MLLGALIPQMTCDRKLVSIIYIAFIIEMKFNKRRFQIRSFVIYLFIYFGNQDYKKYLKHSCKYQRRERIQKLFIYSINRTVYFS